MKKAAYIAAAFVFFMLAGWKVQTIAQDPVRDLLWTNLGLAMFIAGMGNALLYLAAKTPAR